MKILTLFLAVLFSILSKQILFSQTVSFYQDNIIFYDWTSINPDTTINSYFGRANLTFISSDTVKYFNLSVSGGGITNNWPVQNYPVKSLDSIGTSESRYFSFLINDTNSTGVNVDSINYGFSFTADTMSTAPVINSIAAVSDFNFIMFNGLINNNPVGELSLNKPESNEDNLGSTVPGYSIQDCGVDECFPTALSDAAKYLQVIYPLIFAGKDSLITINYMKGITSWTQQGVFMYTIAGNFISGFVNFGFSSNQIPMLMSELYDTLTSNDLDIIIIPSLNALNAVSFFVNYEYTNPVTGNVSNTKHAVSLREMTKINDDLYTFTYSHDATQGIPGGTIVESALYTPSTNTISFPDFANVLSESAATPGMQQTDLGCVVIAKNKTVLTVELTSFTSQVFQRNVILNWMTTYEENNSGFDVERSNVKRETANEWNKINFVQGKGNSNVSQNYSYEDRNLNSGNYKYRLKQINYDGSFEYFYLMQDVAIGIPNSFALYQNYPNPFNPTTKINYDIAVDGYVILKVFDVSGREIKTLINENQTAGFYSVDVGGFDLSSGIYFYVLKWGGKLLSKMMAVVK